MRVDGLGQSPSTCHCVAQSRQFLNEIQVFFATMIRSRVILTLTNQQVADKAAHVARQLPILLANLELVGIFVDR